ncbi:MAG: hypothetical protein NTW85_02290 [Methylococcales bacterium]|nr:hypothetical protein [Methylococcales bacterium]
MANYPTKIPKEIKDIVESINNGDFKNAKMEWNDDGSVKFSADSSDGNSRIIMQKHEFSGISQQSKTDITKPLGKEDRLQRVELLHEQGKTQTEISTYTMTSQKTVSNDIKELKKKKLLKAQSYQETTNEIIDGKSYSVSTSKMT